MGNTTFDIPIKKTISVATIPFFLKGALFFTEKWFATDQSQAPQSLISLIGNLNQIISIIFSDCVTFIIFMLIFTLFVDLIKTSLFQRNLCPPLNSFKVNETSSFNTKQALSSIIKVCSLLCCDIWRLSTRISFGCQQSSTEKSFSSTLLIRR